MIRELISMIARKFNKKATLLRMSLKLKKVKFKRIGATVEAKKTK
jgi:hypothetical protein